MLNSKKAKGNESTKIKNVTISVSDEPMSPYVQERLTSATLEFVKNILKQPGGREQIEAEKKRLGLTIN